MLKAYGKVNLYLDVIKKRDDGYHDILTLFQSIKEHDIIYVDFSEKEFFLKVNQSCQYPGKITY